jgi:hypothetical protein
MEFSPAETWPPVYDFDELQGQIRSRVATGQIFQSFYTSGSLIEPALCQGDIIELDSDFPFIDQNRGISLIEGLNYWIILGNTCDLYREIRDCSNTQICPLRPLPFDAPTNAVSELQNYKPYRKFYIPCWTPSKTLLGYIADLTLICTVEKLCLIQHVSVLARMEKIPWLILHSCLVRYLARSDGRHD